VEAMATGKPVIAYGAGGALETVVEGTTGLFFREPTVEGLIEAIRRADAMTFDAAAIRANAERFAPAVFRRRFIELFERLSVDPSLYRTDQ
jgi:glycosyltransferase involved in cell wall biosynthesis